jgi:uncharacterized protein (DUF4213/DUF364 family)
MKLLDDILNSLNFDARACDIRQGVFHTGLLSRNCGLASTMAYAASPDARPHVTEPGSLLARGMRELAEMAHSSSTMEAAIGMAAINSLIELDEARCKAVNAADVLAEKGKGRNVAIIGHFPFVPRLRQRVGKLSVIEKNQRPGDRAEQEADDILPLADVVGITGTSLTNHTIEHLLELCRKDAYVLMLGDTTPMSAVLFNHGIDAVCGVRVTDPRLALACVSQGATFRQIRGIRLLTLFAESPAGKI